MEDLSYSCLAVDTQFTATTSQSASNSKDMYCGKAKANGIKVETGVIHKGPFQRFLFHIQGPVPASAHDFLLVQNVLLPALHDNERLSGDTGYTGSPAIITPFKKSKRLTSAEKEYNRDVSKVHVTVEHCNRDINIFAACSKRFRHRQAAGGTNLNLLEDIWKVCVFMVNRNLLDAHGQTNAWSIPSRPRRDEPWALKHLTDDVWTQELDDAWGPRGPRRTRPSSTE
jgi:hypothetical protein